MLSTCERETKQGVQVCASGIYAKQFLEYIEYTWIKLERRNNEQWNTGQRVVEMQLMGIKCISRGIVYF